MTDSGNAFGIDLSQLNQVAKSDLPTVSDVYGDAIGKVKTAASAVGAIHEPAEFVSGPSGPVLRAYDDLNQVAVGILTDTKTSLDETAQSLDDAVTAYAETDRAAAAEFNRILHDLGEPKPE